jgi:hypothetical protein
MRSPEPSCPRSTGAWVDREARRDGGLDCCQPDRLWDHGASLPPPGVLMSKRARKRRDRKKKGANHGKRPTS